MLVVVIRGLIYCGKSTGSEVWNHTGTLQHKNIACCHESCLFCQRELTGHALLSRIQSASIDAGYRYRFEMYTK